MVRLKAMQYVHVCAQSYSKAHWVCLVHSHLCTIAHLLVCATPCFGATVLYVHMYAALMLCGWVWLYLRTHWLTYIRMYICVFTVFDVIRVSLLFCNWRRPSWSNRLTCQLLSCYVFAQESIAPPHLLRSNEPLWHHAYRRPMHFNPHCPSPA